MVYLSTKIYRVMAIEKWLAITSVGLFAMFAGEIISVYNFLSMDTPDDSGFTRSFAADPKILQFISIGAAPAGITAAVAFIMSRQYGSKLIGSLIILGGTILFAGMVVSYSILGGIDEVHITTSVQIIPILFMALSPVVIVFGVLLLRPKKKRPKKEFF